MIKIKEDFLIEIISTQSVKGEEKEEIKLTTRGTMKKIKDQIYIIYKEYSNKIAGTCVIKFRNDLCVNIIRHGNTESRLILEKGKKHYCPYCVKEGSFVFGIFTNAVDIDYSGDKCKLDLKYSLDVNSQLISNNIISVTAQKIENKKEN